MPEGVTYSEYAHQGFNQLIVVVVINLVIVLLLSVSSDEHEECAALTVFTACTFVMIASAFVRIFMYIGAYHLTELRFWLSGTVYADVDLCHCFNLYF